MIQTLRNRVHFLTVLRNKNYRRYYFGLLASVSSHQAMIAALGWLVYDMTQSPALVGTVAAVQALPSIVLSLVTGALADRIDQRRLIIFGEGGAALLIGVLVILIATGLVEPWHVMVIAFLAGVSISFDQPARRSIWPVLIHRDHMLFATSLNQTAWAGTRVISPAIALGTIAVVGSMTGDFRVGASISFVLIALGFLGMVIAMTTIMMPVVPRSKGSNVLQDMIDGLAFTYRNRIFLVLMLMGFVTGYFGLSYQWLLPAFAEEVMGDGTGSTQAILMTANGVGGLAGVLGVASFGAYQNRGWLLIGGALAFGVAVVLFGAAGAWAFLPLALFAAACAGALHSLFQVAAGTVTNLIIPHEYRGRVLGLRGLTWSLAPMGALQAGLIAEWVNTAFSIALGGIVVILFTLLMVLWSKELRNVRTLVDEAESIEWVRPAGR
ncbi:MAG: MFS transporter [Dehalococcoidia bacterium]